MKAIKAKIKSVQNINQITKALEVVSTVKLRKVKEQTDTYRNFMNQMIALLQQLSSHIDIFEIDHVRSEDTLVIVIGSEKGLCGSLNAKLFKHVYATYENSADQTHIYAVGKKSKEFFARNNFEIAGTTAIKDSFDTSDLFSLYDFVHQAIEEGRYKHIRLAFNYFHNALSQEPVFLDLFPLNK
jgi:F-type H+-transporting ATPase subunit gamma